MTFLKQGKAARKEASVVDAQRKARDEENRFFRFFVKRGTERQITFLDGALDEDGELMLTTYYEHNLYMNGNWRNFYVCTGNEKEPCPICEEGKLPAMVAPFTIIDHTEYTDKKGVTHKDQVMLLLAKRGTQKLLEYQAAKRGGLAGVTFDVARIDEDQSAAVGTSFDYVEKNDVAAVMKKYKAEVIKYEDAINYKTPDELRKMGFGKTQKMGDEPGVNDDDPPFAMSGKNVPEDDDEDISINVDDMDEDV